MAEINFNLDGDAGNLLKKLTDARDGLREITKESKDLKSLVSDSFRESAAAAEKFETAIGSNIKNVMQEKAAVEALTKKLAEMGQASKTAGEGGTVKGLKDNLADAKKKADEAAAAIAKIKLNPNDASVKTLSAAIQSAKADVGTFAAAIEATKQKMAMLDEGSEEFKTLSAAISEAEESLKLLSNETGETETKTKSLKAQLRAMKEELAALESAGQEGTQEFRNLQMAAGELEDQIGDTSQRVRVLASDTFALDAGIGAIEGLAGAFAVVEGTMAALGFENEDLQKSLQKLSAIMAVLQGVQAIQNVLQKQSAAYIAAETLVTKANAAAKVVLTFVTGGATVATKALRVAMTGLGIGLLIAGIVALVSKIKDWTSSTDDAEGAQKRLSDATEKLNKNLDDQLGFLDQENKKRQLLLKIAGANEQALLDDRVNARKQEIEAIRSASDERAKAFAKEIKNFEKGSEQYNNAILKLREDQDTYRKKEIALANETDLDILQNKSEAADKARKIAEDSDKKLADKRKENEQKRKQDAIEANKRLIELEKELAKARLDAMAEGRAKDIATENTNSSIAITDLKNRKAADGTTPAEKEKLNQLIRLEESNHLGRLMAIEMQYYVDAKQAFDDAQESISQVILGDQAKEEAELTKRYDTLIKVARDAQAKLQAEIEAGNGKPGDELAIAAQEDAITALNAFQLKEREDLQVKFKVKAIKEANELSQAQIDILVKDGISQKALEDLKTQMKLEAVIDGAEKEMAVLEATGDAKYALEIALLKKTIQVAKGELEAEAKNGGGFNLFSLLGLGDLDENTKQDLISGFTSITNSVTDVWNAGVQARIDAQQRLVDELTRQLEEQESIVDREKELMEAGYANNYTLEEKKLEDLKRRNESEKEELKKQQESQQKFAAAQRIIQGTVTAINLVVAASNYFAQGSKYGPIAGTILALAAIATMFATFIGAKSKAADVGKYRYGGGLDMTGSRRSHEEGGINLVDNKTGETLAEAEGGEYAFIFKDGRKAKKLLPLFESINKNQLPGSTYEDLISFSNRPQLNDGVLEKIADLSNQKNTVVIVNNNAGVIDMHTTLKQVEKNTRPGKTVDYFDGYRIEKEGNITRKIFDFKQEDVYEGL
jgi:hypothetical protein